MKLKHKLKQHVSENRWQYLLIALIFVAGILVGDYKALGLASGVKSHLLALIDDYLKGGTNADLDKQVILCNSFINQGKSIIAVWFLGLTIIGMPLILGVVFLKGFSLGFTISFLVKERAVSGILISILSILPQNLVYIPLLIIWSVVGINFSIYIARARPGGVIPLGRQVMSYTLLMLVFLGIVLIGALIEAYLSPWFLGLFI
ncbi:MAG: stage II sporulation protein M [Syntrophomonas sp.]|nr:stage II sporulation protein M [Syntrophomonas sp.]